MNADIHILHQSSFYKITDFRCKCDICSTSKSEYQEHFSISFVRKGSFIYKVFRNSLEAFNGRFLVNKPNHEHMVTHFDNLPDQCTIISFKESFYELIKEEYNTSNNSFFTDNDIQSLILKSSAETEFLHAAIIKAVRLNSLNSLVIDALVTELVHKIMNSIENNQLADNDSIFRAYHLSTMENAKQFIHNNFDKDISLFEIAENCFVSPFHFSRLFKTFTGISPHQYLMETRLKNADILLRNTSLPVTQISFASGFNNPDHFSTVFKKRYNIQPSKLRNKTL